MTERKTLKSTFRNIKLDQIDRPKEVARMEIDEGELKELAQSIQERGLMQPIGVTPRAGRFMVVYGDRRYLAHKMLNKKDILCRVEDIKDLQVVIDRAMENVQRVNLTPFEEGHIYNGLLEKANMTLEEICKRVGKSPGVVQRRMDILRMPDSFQKALHQKTISLTVAEELWSCPDESRREYFVELAAEHGITAEIARNWVQEFRKAKRQAEKIDKEGGGVPAAFEDLPIYRGCDVCKGPVEYKDLEELRTCPKCYKAIMAALKNDN